MTDAMAFRGLIAVRYKESMKESGEGFKVWTVDADLDLESSVVGSVCWERA